MKNDKSPGSDGFTAEFFKVFWIDIGKFIHWSINFGVSLICDGVQPLLVLNPHPNWDSHVTKQP